MLKGSVGLVALASLLMTGAALAQEKIKVGVTATLEGTYTVLGEDGIRGFQTALNKFGTKIGDKQLEFVDRLHRRDPQLRGARRPQADRTGQGADPAFAFVGRRRHRGQELRQDASRN